MIRLSICIALCLTLYNCNNPRPTPRPMPVVPTPTIEPPTPTPTLTSTPTPTPIPTPIPIPLAQPCAVAGDVTPAILDATAAGEVHSGGGCIRTQLVVEHELKLGLGVYQVVKPILVKSGGTLVGSGWDTVIMEPTGKDDFVVVATYAMYFRNGDGDSDITVKDFKVVGANPGFFSAPPAISMGNCINCTVDNLWLDRTRSIGVALGGSAQFGLYAKDSKITNCLFTHVASQSIAVVNGENIEVSGNRILRPGQAGGPGNTSIDLEVNDCDDRLINIKIINNVIDHRGAEQPTTGNGIMVNSSSCPIARDIIVDSNVIIGGDLDPPKSHLSNGIMVYGTGLKGARITNNKITRTGQCGIWLQGAELVVEDNTLDSVGGGGTEGFIASVTNSIVRRNSYKCASGVCSPLMKIEGEGNTIEDNPGWVRMAPRSGRKLPK